MRNEMKVAAEEIFGRVLSIIPFDEEEEAVLIATTRPMVLPAACGRRISGVACG